MNLKVFQLGGYFTKWLYGLGMSTLKFFGVQECMLIAVYTNTLVTCTYYSYTVRLGSIAHKYYAFGIKKSI